MQAFLAPIGAAAAFVYGASYVVADVANRIAANHPLVVAERKCWAKPDHSLDVDQGKQRALHVEVDRHFKLDSELELCFIVLRAAGSMIEYEHW